MAHEKFELYAIQNKGISDFTTRFRIFGSKEDRDGTLIFLKENLEPMAAEDLDPVILAISVKTDQNNQLTFNLSDTG